VQPSVHPNLKTAWAVVKVPVNGRCAEPFGFGHEREGWLRRRPLTYRTALQNPRPIITSSCRLSAPAHAESAYVALSAPCNTALG
jgi:hypothetical protein